MAAEFSSRKRIGNIAVAGAVMTLALCGAASAYTLHTLYSFCTAKGCPDGKEPLTGLLIDASGNLYGTTSDGGAHKHGGTIFQLSPSGSNWTYSVLYSFCAEKKCADGYAPSSRLVVDTGGNLYGTTEDGGTNGDQSSGGTAFELIANAGRTAWTLEDLHDFCSQGGKKCTDGEYPYPGTDLTYPGAASGAPYDGASPLYGAAENEGNSKTNGGVAYRLTLDGGTWTDDVLYDFCARKKCIDGKTPQGGMILDQSGNLFGMTFRGAKGDDPGTVFELSPAGGGAWKETVLHSFCSQAGCADGANPMGDLVADAAGDVFGTASQGGTGAGCSADENPFGCGVVFKLTPAGKGSHQTVLYPFCSLANCTDGSAPSAGLILDGDGNLFGTTENGGAKDSGTVFKLNGGEQVLYSFCAKKKCSDGSLPRAPLIADGAGNLYGTTWAGGAHGQGTVFELTP